MIFRFAHPLVLALLPLPPLLWLVSRWLGWRWEAPSLRYSDTRLLAGLPVSWRVRLRRLPDVLRLLAWLLLVVGLARPQSGRSQDIIQGQGVDIVLALDISGSMAGLDFQPQNRLEAAKSVIADFVAGREFDRIGLVVFASDAFQLVPPTLDYPALLRSLGSVRLANELGIGDATAIGQGLATAANMMRTSAAASKVIILLTDGANTAGNFDPITAAQAVATLDMRVYTIGIGKPGLVPFLDSNGNTITVESDLDEATLGAIADTADGRYFRAEDAADLQQIYEQIDALERSDVEKQVFVRWQEQAWVLLWGGLAALILERVLRHSVFQVVP
ncbi:MAG: VWA domain-containing protein [Anaerolineaceae bacterium]|nr:VWA domain-containing protein [Anaerolineaceae bacterium]